MATAWMLDRPGGFQTQLVPYNFIDSHEQEQRKRDLSSLVTNLNDNSAKEYWK